MVEIESDSKDGKLALDISLGPIDICPEINLFFLKLEPYFKAIKFKTHMTVEENLKLTFESQIISSMKHSLSNVFKLLVVRGINIYLD